MKRKLLAGIALTLAVGACTAVSALAASHATAPIEKHNENCGRPEAEPHVIGVIQFKRVKSTVTLTVKMRHAGKEDSYQVFLMDASTCSSVGLAVTVKTNSKGAGHGQGSVTLSAEAAGRTLFFGDAVRHDETGPEPCDTTVVTLP